MRHHFERNKGLLIRTAVVSGVVAGILAFVLARTLSVRVESVSSEEVWTLVQEIAPQHDLAPEFVYALAWAESSLNARARSSVARGIMQLTKPAWREVTDQSYQQAWDWRTNIRVGIDYLAFCRDFLQQHNRFSYPLLAASYRYGPNYVKKKNFNLRQIKRPKNEIYRHIFEGNIHPVVPPQ